MTGLEFGKEIDAVCRGLNVVLGIVFAGGAVAGLGIYFLISWLFS